MSKSLAYLFVLAFLVGGCELLGSSGLGRVLFATDKPTYKSGERIQTVLVNISRTELRTGACVKSIEGLNDGAWSTLYKPGLCESSQLVLGPGGSFTFSAPTKDLTPAEEYRVTKTVEAGGKSHTIESNHFTLSE